ncbi:TetR/AcrR family transcriptional regulator [Nocardioides dongkuii]|uniref:TetR/AcrR family transcriptional regulator n=1 Tax=Nocardioides dongkuii TaxID=2760089 RepID=UPI0015F93FDB|nr:TetR/AcrR family transcriptional regulator [Nocardioides dongkuii]
MTGVRDRLLDAAEACLRRDGIRRTTVAGVAEEAGVSRAWLYRHFPNKAALLGAALIRLDVQFWAHSDERVRAAEGLAAKVAEAVAIARSSHLGPLALELKEREPEALAAVLGDYVRDVAPGMARFWERHLVEARERGEVRADLDVAGASEWVLRVIISLVTLPGAAVDPDDPDSVRAYLQTYLVPALT